MATGKCRAAVRHFENRTKYVPTVAGMVCQISEYEEDCYRTSKEAVAAAEAFRDEAREKLVEEFGR
ncbi:MULTISPECIES: hypothetical protein [unclassified Bradyrhizobium]|uniref:hypothetical protein n=1 Tax=unclassified Bradyrhizobium TaxID=2631580 RepID=UPI00291685D1|nr:MULTISPECIES: hypothetical protein [unclassified Bradyrhizobium]